MTNQTQNERDTYKRWDLQNRVLIAYACAVSQGVDHDVATVERVGKPVGHPENSWLIDYDDGDLRGEATYGPDSSYAWMLEQLRDRRVPGWWGGLKVTLSGWLSRQARVET